MGSSYQVLATPNNATYVGSGKVAEIIQAVRAYGVDTVIFDDELSPGQLRNLEKVLGCGNGSVRVGAGCPVRLCFNIESCKALLSWVIILDSFGMI
eukprot:1162075-Pelagomonas_calceolata.AAC.12